MCAVGPVHMPCNKKIKSERERETQRERFIHMYIAGLVHLKLWGKLRERERERETERERAKAREGERERERDAYLWVM